MNDELILPPDDQFPLEGEFSAFLERYEQLLQRGESTESLEQQIRESFGIKGIEVLKTIRWFYEIQEEPAESASAKEPPTVRISEDKPIATFGRFRVIERIGAGGNGVVFRVFDPQLYREAALKVPRTERIWLPEHERRFLHEARTAAALQHPQIVSVYEAGNIDGVNYILSAYCSGPSLAQWMQKQRSLQRAIPARLAAEWMAMVADAMEYTHAQGVVHRDLKPGNILLEPDSAPQPEHQEFEAYTPRITDFGIAKFQSESQSMTLTGVILGTLPYMAPEQTAGSDAEPSPQVDIYSIGAMLYELLTGRPPLIADSELELLRKIGADDPPLIRSLRPDISGDLEAICLKCLERNPHERYQSASALSRDLRRFLGGEHVEARPVSGVRRFVRSVFRKRVSIKVAAAIVVGLGMIALWFGIQYRQSRRSQEELAQQVHATKVEAGEHQAAREKLQSQVIDTYAADMSRIMRLWESSSVLLYQPADAVAQMKEVLRRHIPPIGTVDPRGFEWFLLSRLCEPDRYKKTITRNRELPGHTGNTYFVKFSADDRYLFSAGEDRTVKLWDVNDGRLLKTYVGHTGEIDSFDLSPDETRLATASEDYSVRVFDVDTNRQQHHFTGHKAFVVSVAFDRTGRYVLSADHLGDCRIWDLVKNAEIGQFQGHSHRIQSLYRTSDYSIPEGSSRFVSSAQDGRAHVWNLDFNNLKPVAPANTISLNGQWTAFIPSCRQSDLLAAIGRHHGDTPSQLTFIRPDTKSLLDVFSTDFLQTGSFTADCRRFVYAGRDCPMGIVDLASRKSWDVPGTDKSLNTWHLAASKNGCYLATGDRGGKISIWNADLHPEYLMLRGVSDLATHLQWSPDGRWLAAGRLWFATGLQSHTPSFLLYDFQASPPVIRDLSSSLDKSTQTGGQLTPREFSWGSNITQFSRDSRRMYVLSNSTHPGVWHCRIYDLISGELVRSVKLPDVYNPRDSIPTLFIVDEQNNSIQTLCSASESTSRLDRFDLDSGQHLGVFKLDGVTARLLTASHGDQIALPYDRDLRLYDRRTGTLQKTITLPTAQLLTGVKYSPDGSRIAASDSIGGTVYLCDCSTGQTIGVMKSVKNGSFESLAFSPDGRRLVGGARGHPTGSDYIDVWAVPEGTETRPRLPLIEIPIPAGGMQVMSLQFSPDGRSLAVGITATRSAQSTLSRNPHGESAVAVYRISGDEHP